MDHIALASSNVSENATGETKNKNGNSELNKKSLFANKSEVWETIDLNDEEGKLGNVFKNQNIFNLLIFVTI